MMNKEYDYELIFDDEVQVEVDYEEQTVRFFNNKTCTTYTCGTAAKDLRKLKNYLQKIELNRDSVMFNFLARGFAV